MSGDADPWLQDTSVPRGLETGRVEAGCAACESVFLVTCAFFAAQASLHWLLAFLSVAAGRAQQHELLSAGAAGVCAVLYLAAGCGVSATTYASSSGDGRFFYPILFAARVLGVGLLMVNTATLARERRPPIVALAAAWLTQMTALYLGHCVQGTRRWLFLAAAAAFLVPLAGTLCATMGSRLRLSSLQTVYRFLSTWCVLGSISYCLAFLCCEVLGMLDELGEAAAYASLDFLLIGLGSLAVSCAGPEKQAVMLPAQEAEFSLYPGPHSHGFYPNPDFYDDNL